MYTPAVSALAAARRYKLTVYDFLVAAAQLPNPVA